MEIFGRQLECKTETKKRGWNADKKKFISKYHWSHLPLDEITHEECVESYQQNITEI